MVRVLGIDPGLRRTGWGVVIIHGARLTHVAHGVVAPKPDLSTGERLAHLQRGLAAVIEQYAPQEAAVEETFVNADPRSALKLGLARGVCMLAPAMADLPVAEYAPRLVKKSVVGTGRADKEQIAAMMRVLLPAAGEVKADEADALAIAITHCHHRADPRVAAQQGAKSADGSTGGYRNFRRSSRAA